MPELKSFSMRPGGFAVFFFGALIVLMLAVVGIVVRQGPRHDYISYFLCLGLCLSMAGYLAYFLRGQQVSVANGWLRVCYIFGSAKPVRWALPLAEIDQVLLTTIGHLRRDHPDLAGVPAISAMIVDYETEGLSSGPAAPPGLGTAILFMVLGRAVSSVDRKVGKALAKMVPLIIVVTRDAARTRAIPTKPFSKKDCLALMAALAARGVRTHIDEKI